MAVVKLKPQHSAGGRIVGQRPPRVQSGVYEAVYVRHEFKLMFGNAPKLIVWFGVVTPGQYHGVELPRYFNVLRFYRGGTFDVAPSCDFVIEYSCCLGDAFDRHGAIEPDSIKTLVLKVGVEVVAKTRGKKLPESLQYSKVQELLGVV